MTEEEINRLVAEPDREPINIHPEVKRRLRQLLMQHEDFATSGTGYSKFIMLAIIAAEEGRL